MSTLNYGEESVSVGIEEVKTKDWAEQVYEPSLADRCRSASTNRLNAAEDWRRLG
jgi:phenylpyruvate tautomerase PptA (4-oxalocrotonate tautomerase family)